MRYLYPFHLFNAQRSHSYIQYQVHCSGSYRFSKVRHGWWRESSLVQMGFACGIVGGKPRPRDHGWRPTIALLLALWRAFWSAPSAVSHLSSASSSWSVAFLYLVWRAET